MFEKGKIITLPRLGSCNVPVSWSFTAHISQTHLWPFLCSHKCNPPRVEPGVGAWGGGEPSALKQSGAAEGQRQKGSGAQRNQKGSRGTVHGDSVIPLAGI